MNTVGRRLQTASSEPIWWDMPDPVTGCPIHGQRGSFTFHELSNVQTLLHYPTVQMGFCAVISHPRWHTNVYPATWFASGPPDLLFKTLNSVG